MLSRYSFLPESLAVVVIGGEHEGSGVLYRESTPYPFVSEERVRVPFHALYALDQFVPEDEPLLVQLVRLNGGSSPLRYFVEEVAGLILEAWVLLVSKRGLLPELHGQNSLAEIDATLTLRRMVHRDFQGTYSDPRIRVMKGLPIFTKHVVGVEPGTTVQSQYSHVFDGMIGRYLLERLTKTFCRYFGREYVAVVKAIAAYHKSLPGWDAADFPKTTFRFGDQAKEQIGNEVRLVDTGLLPEFR